MILLDVNVLVHAHREDAPRHVEFRDFLAAALEGPEPCGVSELVLSGWVRVVTHPRVFQPPTPLPRALEFAQAFRDHPNCLVVRPGNRHWNLFIDLCRRADARGHLVSDAYHAALALESGCDWITTDRNYARFPGLRWRHPLDS